MKYASRIPKNTDELFFVGTWEGFDLYVVKFFKDGKEAEAYKDKLNSKIYPEIYQTYAAKDFRLAQLFGNPGVRALPL